MRSLPWLATATVALALGCGPTPPGTGDDTDDIDAAAGDPDAAFDDQDASCGAQSQDIAVENLGDPPDLLIVMDRSGSMSGPIPSFPPTFTPKWTIMRDALNGVVMQRQDNIRFGLSEFPTNDDCAVAPATAVRVPIDLGQAPEVAQYFMTRSPNGNTPAAGGLQAALAHYNAIPVNPAGRYVLFATDGEPNCAVDDATAAATTVAAVTALRQAGIDTFVLGFGGAFTVGTVLNDAALPIDAALPVDAALPIDAAPPIDAALPIDAAPPIDAAGCGIVGAAAITLDGVGDLAAYPAAQTVPVTAPFAADDAVRLSWSPTALYLTVRSTVFGDGSRPYHLYLQAATTLPAAVPSAGKEYGGLTAQLSFAPTHLIAIRRTDDFGSGPYDGVYVPAGPQPWATRATALVPGTDVYASSDNAELSVRVPWSALGGCPLRLRVAGHVVNGGAGNEWKTVVPTGHTPWMAPGGTAYTIELTGPAAVSGWAQ